MEAGSKPSGTALVSHVVASKSANSHGTPFAPSSYYKRVMRRLIIVMHESSLSVRATANTSFT